MKQQRNISSLQKILPLSKTTMVICSKYGALKICNPSVTFFAGKIKDVVPTLGAMKKMIQLDHDEGIDMLKLGFTLPNAANIFLQSSTSANFYPFPKEAKDWLEKKREDMVDGPVIVFQAVVGETKIRSTSNNCKSKVGIDASELYPYAICQPLPTGL